MPCQQPLAEKQRLRFDQTSSGIQQLLMSLPSAAAPPFRECTYLPHACTATAGLSNWNGKESWSGHLCGIAWHMTVKRLFQLCHTSTLPAITLRQPTRACMLGIGGVDGATHTRRIPGCTTLYIICFAHIERNTSRHYGHSCCRSQRAHGGQLRPSRCNPHAQKNDCVELC